MNAIGYLVVVLDAHSREVVGWALADHLKVSLAIAVLEMVLAQRRPVPGSLIHHSDRGVQYACVDYGALLRRPRYSGEHEPGGQSLRQRQGGERHEDAEERGGPGHSLSRPGAGALADRPLHRRLQSPGLHSALDYLAPQEYETSSLSD
jgi:transposase InsO family protein